MQTPLVVVDSSIPEKIDALQREISELKNLIVNFAPQDRPTRRLRLQEVVSRLGIGKTKWWEGIKDGRCPAGILDRGIRFWREDEIDELVNRVV